MLKTIVTEVVTGLILLVAFLVCWETWHSDKGPSKKDQAKSQLEVIIRKIDKAHREMHHSDSFQELDLGVTTDPWGHQLLVEFLKGDKKNILELRSAGPDGLPYTKDDIVVTKEYQRDHTPLSKKLEAGIESVMRGLTRGSVGGAREGLREGGPITKEK